MDIFNLIKKDLKIIISDKKALIVLIGMPIILFAILSTSLKDTFDSEVKCLILK